MANQADALDGEIEVDEPELVEEPAAETPQEPEEPEKPAEPEEPNEGDEEFDEITFGDEAAPASSGENSETFRELRKRYRALAEENNRLKAGHAEPQQIEVGERPTLESCEYDEAKFEEALDAWKDRKAQAENTRTESEKRTQAVNARFAEKVANFGKAKAAMKVKDFEAAEEMVTTTLTPVQTAVVIKAAENSAHVIYALGRHPQKLTALSAIEDPIELAAAVARLEGSLKVTTRRRAAPDPDEAVRGSAPLRNGEDKALARLEAEADRTGDRTKVVKYKRDLREKAAKR